MSKINLNETFWKLKTYLDICYEKRNKNNNTVSEVISIFLSNFSGEELMAFREAQRKK